MIPGIIAQRIRVAADPPGPATIEMLFDAGTDRSVKRIGHVRFPYDTSPITSPL